MKQTTLIRNLLLRDPIWSAFALADLHPPLAQHSHWTYVETPAGAGVTLLYRGFVPNVLLTVGPPATVAATLANSPLPERVYLSVREEHFPVVQAYYECGTEIQYM